MMTNDTTFAQRADKLSNLYKTMEHRSSGEELKILKHLLKAMGVTSAGFSLPKKGSVPLFLGLSIATIGIYSSESESGIIGPALEKITKALTNSISDTIMPGIGVGGKQFLTMLCVASYTFIACFTSQISRHGLGRLPDSLEGVDLKLAHFFAFEMSLKLLNGSLILKEAFKIFIEACGGDKEAQRIGASILAEVGQLLIILTGSNEAQKPANYLISEETFYLKQGIHAAAEIVAKAESEGTINPEVAVAVNQLRIALNDNNEMAFVEALDKLLENVGTSIEEVLKDLQQLHRVTSMVTNVTGLSHNEAPFSGIINVI